jgi:hypothetical protein
MGKKIPIFIFAILFMPRFLPAPYAFDYNLQDPQSFIFRKLKQNNILFLGTRHKQPPILKFIQDLIPKLLKAGVTHIGLEIASDQQAQIDHYMKTGEGLNDIKIHSLIDCPEYRENLKALKGIHPNKRPSTDTLDLPVAEFKGGGYES